MIENKQSEYSYEDTNKRELFKLREEPVLIVYREVGSVQGIQRELIGEFTVSVCGNLSKMRGLLANHDPESLEFTRDWHDFFNPTIENNEGNPWR